MAGRPIVDGERVTICVWIFALAFRLLVFLLRLDKRRLALKLIEARRAQVQIGDEGLSRVADAEMLQLLLGWPKAEGRKAG